MVICSCSYMRPQSRGAKAAHVHLQQHVDALCCKEATASHAATQHNTLCQGQGTKAARSASNRASAPIFSSNPSSAANLTPSMQADVSRPAMHRVG